MLPIAFGLSREILPALRLGFEGAFKLRFQIFLLPITGADIFGCAQSPDLPGIQSRAARAPNAMRAIGLADREKMRQRRRFPPEIPGKPAIIMLEANRDLQRFFSQVNPLPFIKLDSRGVQLPQPLQRRPVKLTAHP
ncbi:hypothetical protein SDC9_198351 [bioreactor metagenome]|uniref:Uncharacterized protein n=1 Tax=bioreactor metagenome TaxID=1076179 RepID=A0A645IHE7_9ZZZZ